jgi:hypothetical protein
VRQRSLERLGWVFWRCFASHWASDRKDCLNSLIDKLNELGIERLGNDNIKQTKHTEHLVIRSEDYHKYGMDEITDEDSGTAKSGPTKDSIVEIGDFVVIRFNDENKSQRIKLTNNDNTRKGEINHKHPIGAAILGASKEDEVEVEIEGELRKILIEDFFKPEQSKSNKSNYQK